MTTRAAALGAIAAGWLAAAVLACGPPPTPTAANGNAGDSEDEDATTPSAERSTPVTEGMPELADSTREAIDWVASLHDPTTPPLDEATYEARFSRAFRDQVSLAQLRPVIDTMKAEGPWETHCTMPKDAWRVGVQYRASDGEAGFLARIAIVPEQTEIEGFVVSPAPWLSGEPPGSWAALEGELGQLGERTTLFAAEVAEDGSMETIHAVSPDAVMPIGSAFKLWVLHRLAADVDAGRHQWDQALTVEEGDRSFSSVELDQFEDGAEVPLEDAAAAMIRSSDNTATDMIIDLLGRERIEETTVALAPTSGVRNVPFLRTRDMFWLKLQADDETRSGFVDGDEQSRRELVAGIDEEWDLGAAAWRSLSWSAPRQIDTIEWFATAEELAATFVALRDTFETTESGETVARILSYNTGIQSCGGWSYLGFKGGSEPGVMNLTWLGQRDDGRWFVLVLGATSEAELVDAQAMTSLAWHGLNRLTEHP